MARNCRIHQRRRRQMRSEPLERRRLLAADLWIEHDDPAAAAFVGEEVTRTIRVHNVGDEVADQAIVHSSLVNELQGPSWTRRVGPAKFIGDPFAGQSIDFFADATAYSGIDGIGDFNGDGNQDFLADNAIILWQNEVSARVVQFPPLHDFRPRPIYPLGDINGDGMADLAWKQYVLLGRSELSEELDFEASDPGLRIVFPSWVFGVGDLNRDGLTDIAVSTSEPEEGVRILG